MESLSRHEESSHEESSDGILLAKIVTMCVLFVTSLIVGTSPLYLSKCFKWKNDMQKNGIVVRLLCFGGGVLLCTTFLHLLPEVEEKIEELQENNLFPSPDLELHFAEFFMCAGFLILYFVEELLHWYIHKREKDSSMIKGLTRTFSIKRYAESSNSIAEFSKTSTINLTKADVENNTGNGCTRNYDHIDHSHLHVDSAVLNSFRGFFIVLALSIHELFEGLAVGLEDTTSSVWYMFGAVAAHKIVIAFCIGVELMTTGINKILTVIYIFTFAVVSPLGIGIGIALSEDQQERTEVVSVVLQGLASGTLLYIVFFEILRTDRKGGLKTVLAVFIGFSVMFCITVFTPHSHSHSHEH